MPSLKHTAMQWSITTDLTCYSSFPALIFCLSLTNPFIFLPFGLLSHCFGQRNIVRGKESKLMLIVGINPYMVQQHLILLSSYASLTVGTGVYLSLIIYSSEFVHYLFLKRILMQKDVLDVVVRK